MPWCRTCARLVEDDDVVYDLSGGEDVSAYERPANDKSLPSRSVPAQSVPDKSAAPTAYCPDCGDPFPPRKKAAWHFKMVLVASVVYLGYRAYQGITWLAHHV
ncbi:MAG: hypothetical protein ACYCVV_19595 [Acidimicrobiales bacterium]|nr:hypothetical protein [Actinomycetota bacterium]